jgi:hypothetical protein
MADNGEVSRLPGVMQRRLAAMEAEANPPTNTDTTNPTVGTVVTPPAAVVEPPTPPNPAPSEGDRVTLTRTELNELRAAAERARTADARAEAQADRNAELAHRLTELEAAAKAVPVAVAPATPVAPSVDFTPEELESYADSRGFIEKVVDIRVDKRLAALEARLNEIEGTAKNTATTIATQTTRSFFAEVKSKVPSLDTIIKHKHWADFLDGVEPLSGATYQQLIQHNVQNQRVDQLVNIYKAFAAKYGVEDGPTPSGYEGAVPSGGAVTPPLDPQKAVKLKMSDRKKASKDYQHGKITFAQLEEVNKKFEEADKIGNIDYNA